MMKQLLLLGLLLFSFIGTTQAQCTFQSISQLLFSPCEVNETFTISGTLSFANPPTTGDLILRDCSGYETVVASAPFGATIAFSGNGFVATGANCSLTFRFSNGGCTTPTFSIAFPSCNCGFTNSNLSRGVCDPLTNTYTLTGTLIFGFPPTTGQLIIQNCYGQQVVLNPPFVSPVSYNFPGMPSNGAACSVNAFFTAEAGCDMLHDGWTNQPSCFWECETDAGTFFSFADGMTNSVHPGPYDLCYDDLLLIDSNGDFILPSPQTGIVDENNNPIQYDPGIWLLLYSCAPTLQSPVSFLDDPCFLGVVSSDEAPWVFQNTLGDNVPRWFVPLTMYSQIDGIFDINTIINGQEYHCFDLGEPIQVNFLREITGNVTQDCQLGTVTTRLQGGKPSQVTGQTFNIVPASVTPVNATIVQGSATNGGDLIIGGLTPGQTYSYIIRDGVGCGVIVSGTYVGPNNATISYPNTAFCLGSGTVNPTITGTTGGVFSSTTGLVLNAVSGVVNTTTSTPGAYTVTYTPPGGYCANPTTTTITIHPRPTLVTANNTMCLGEPVTLNVSGANTYSWTPAATLTPSTGASVVANPTTNTNYTVTGTDVNGCTNTASVTVTVFPQPILAGVLSGCIGQTRQLTYSATVNPINPFVSSNPAVATVNGTGIVTGVSPGTTEITYTNSNGCSRTVTFLVHPNPVITVNSPTICQTGTATLTATGGAMYSWTPATNLNVTNTASVVFTPGETTNYTVRGTTANGCSNTAVSTVTVLPNAPINAGVDQTICLGDAATLSAIGGVSYNWNNGLGAGQNQTVSPTSNTIYTVTGTDENGCVGADQVLVSVLPLPTASISGTTNVCVGGAAPMITLTSTSVNAPFTFTYTINGGTTQTIVSTGSTLTIPVPTTTEGVYTYALTGITDAIGCSQAQTGQAIVTVNTLPSATISDGLTVCQGQVNPSLTLTGVNGGAPYTFTYTINNGMPITVNSNMSGIAQVVVPTTTVGTFTYQLTNVTSANGCGQAQTAQSTVIIQPLPIVTATVPSLVCQGAPQPSVTFTATGGTAPYVITYNINGGAPQTINTAGNSAIVPVLTTTPGVFNFNVVSVTDNDGNGCVNNQSVTATVTVSASPIITGTLSVCLGSTSQLMGTAPVSTVNPWVSSNPAVATISNTGLVTALSVGSTTITYTNEAGCVISENFSVVTSPTIFVPAVSVCPGTPISLTATGAQNYSWIPATNLNTTAGATVVFTGNVAQTYTVTGVDASGCTGTTTVTVDILPLPTITASADQVICPGGNATIFATGGVSYTWDNGLGAGQTQTVSPTSATNYTVTVTGANGCINTDQVLISLSTPPTANVAGGTTVCQSATNPQVVFTGTNGTAPYTFTYTLNGGGVLTAVSDATGIARLNVSTVAVGTQSYVLTGVTDVNGCSWTTAATSDFVILPLPLATITGNANVCQNAAQPQITITGTNGTAPYVFTYSLNGAGAQTVISDGNGIAQINAPTTIAGTYTYTLTQVADATANACSQVQTGTASVVVTPLPTATIAGSVNVCQGDASPMVTFTGANGIAPYTFSYNINGGTTQTIISAGNSASLLVPTGTIGTFNYNLISVGDNTVAGCSQPQAGTATFVVNTNPSPVIAGQEEYCIGNTATVNTTQFFNSYVWSNGQITANAQVTAANNPVVVTVTNAFGCQATSAPFNVTENTTIINNTTIAICQGQAATIHGVVRTVAGVYTNTVPSVQGCDSTSNVTLLVNSLPNVNAGVDRTICTGESVTLTAGGATNFNWNNGVTNGVPFQPTATQIYTVTGTDANGCTNADQVVITVNAIPTIAAINNQTICSATNSSAVTFTGNLPGTTFSWINSNPVIGLAANGNGNIAMFNGVNATGGSVSGTVTVTPSLNGCTGTPTTFTITVLPAPTASISGTTSVCVNSTMPQVTFTGANGTAPYTFRYSINNGAVLTTNSVGNTAVINVPVNNVGIYNYRLVGVSESSGSGCQATADQTAVFTVTDLPTGTVSTPVTICQNTGNTTVTFTGTGGTAPYTFTYTINGAAPQTIVSTGSVATLTLPSTAVGTTIIALTSVQEASGLACARALNLNTTVTVLTLPTPSVLGTLTHCEGGTTTLNTQNYNSYNWSSGHTTQTANVSAANNPITLQVTDANGCQAVSAPITLTQISTIRTNRTVAICQGASTSIHGIVKTIAGVYEQTFTSLQGCDSVSTVTLVVNPLPNVTVPADQTICQGESVTLAGAGAQNYVWTNGITNGVPFQPNEGIQNYTVTGTDANGCQNTAVATVNVRAIPVMNAIANQTLCADVQSTEIIFSSTPQGTFTWTNSEVNIGLVANGTNTIPSFRTVNTTNSPLSGSILVTPTADGCIGQAATFTITVQPASTLQASVNETSVCLDAASPVINLTMMNGTAPFEVTYTINGGAAQTIQGGNTMQLSVPTTAAGNYSYTFTAVNESSAQACSTTINETVQVEVHALPVVNAGQDVQLCPAEDYLLNATGTAVNYVWNNGGTNGDQITINNPLTLQVTGVDVNGCVNTDQVTVTLFTPIAVDAGPDQRMCIGDQVILQGQMVDQSNGIYNWDNGVVNGQVFRPQESRTYTLAAQDINGCIVTDEVVITVNNLPVISAGPNIAACIGQDVTLSGAGANGGTYIWDNGVTNGVAFIPAEGVTIYTVVGTDLNGCQNTSTVEVFVQAQPIVSFTAVQNGFCAPVEVVFTNTSPIIGTNCIWTIDGLTQIAGCGTQTMVFDRAGDYSVTLSMETNENGCVGTSRVDNAVQIDQTPIARFTYSPEVVTQIQSTVDFNNETAGGPASYFWEISNQATSTEMHPTHNFGNEVTAHNVTLTATSPLGCADKYTQVIKIKEEFIFFIPNAFTPDGSNLNEIFQPVFVSGFDPFDFELLIFNRWGEIIFESHDASIGWNGRYGVEGNICPDGVYSWKINVKTDSNNSGDKETFSGHVTLLR